ncbi:MAG: (Fe-S)-binding protein [Candidatus Lernaella stagnicola]|nr:(Fe-S)-binding protein [Candidatus Lernaella stagnicola]
MDYFAPFDAERCIGCGECFHQCPVMELPLDVARAEVARLDHALPTKHVLQRCTSCFACNFICPEGANPAQRILDRWHEQNRRSGRPARSRYFDPLAEDNFRTHLLGALPAEEKALLRQWTDTSPCEEIFFPGCNIITAPYLMQTKLLGDLNIRGTLAECCGEMYFRAGQFDKLRSVAAHLTAWSRRLGFKKMTLLCTAGWNLFTNVLPRYGAVFDFEVEHLLPRLVERFERGELTVSHPLHLTVTIQESCHAKFFGDQYMDLPRRLLKILGAEVVESRRNRERALCCGIGGGFSASSAYHPWNLTRETLRAWHEAKQTGADAVVSYCAGCLQMLSVGKLSYPTGMPVYHLLELARMATGEKLSRPQGARARRTLGGVVVKQGPLLLSRRRLVD